MLLRAPSGGQQSPPAGGGDCPVCRWCPLSHSLTGGSDQTLACMWHPGRQPDTWCTVQQERCVYNRDHTFPVMQATYMYNGLCCKCKEEWSKEGGRVGNKAEKREREGDRERSKGER